MIHLQTLQEALKLTDPADDGPAFTVMEDVISAVERETMRYFNEPKEFVRRLIGGEQILWLPERSLIDPNAVPPHRFDVHEWTGEEWVEFDPDSYELMTDENDPSVPVQLVHDTCWPEPTLGLNPRNIRVTHWCGYEIGHLPGDIQRLVLEKTAQRWLDRGKENMRSEKIGDAYAYTRDRGATGSSSQSEEWDRIVHLWRPRVFA